MSKINLIKEKEKIVSEIKEINELMIFVKGWIESNKEKLKSYDLKKYKEENDMLNITTPESWCVGLDNNLINTLKKWMREKIEDAYRKLSEIEIKINLN